MTSLRRLPAFLRLDDALAVLFSLALILLGATHLPFLEHVALARFLGLVAYYAVMFLFSRWLARTPNAGVWHKRAVLASLVGGIALFSLGTRASPAFDDVKNFVVLSLPLVLGAWSMPASASSAPSPSSSSHLLRDFAPFLVSQAAYLMLHDLVHVINPVDRDAWLIRADRILFGGALTQALEPFVRPWLTEWFSATYSLYVFFPLALAIWFVARRERDALRHLLQAVVLCNYLGYLGYLLVPAVGPMYTLTYQVPLSGGWFSLVRESLDTLARVPRDCFPSLHTANTVVVLWMVRRHARPLQGIFGVLGTSCILATIYLRYHYTVDVVAGFALGVAVAWATPRLDHGWRRSMARLTSRLTAARP